MAARRPSTTCACSAAWLVGRNGSSSGAINSSRSSSSPSPRGVQIRVQSWDWTRKTRPTSSRRPSWGKGCWPNQVGAFALAPDGGDRGGSAAGSDGGSAGGSDGGSAGPGPRDLGAAPFAWANGDWVLERGAGGAVLLVEVDWAFRAGTFTRLGTVGELRWEEGGELPGELELDLWEPEPGAAEPRLNSAGNGRRGQLWR